MVQQSHVGLAIMPLAIILLIGLALSIFWIWAMIDCLISSKPPADKLLWFLVILFLHVLGAIIYFVVGRSGRSTAV